MFGNLLFSERKFVIEAYKTHVMSIEFTGGAACLEISLKAVEKQVKGN